MYPTSQKALFLDRDGIINVDHGYTSTPDNFQFIPGIIDLLQHAQIEGYRLIIITNQSGIRRGYYSEAQFQIFTTWIHDELAKHNIHITATYHCPHLPTDNCHCRKPNPGMIQRAKREWQIDLVNSWLIGDKLSDIQAGIAAGIPRVILKTDGLDQELGALRLAHPEVRIETILELHEAIGLIE
jgi:D-glycero-D-manno-heptose 1,7-bisphosphate phosphatase